MLFSFLGVRGGTTKKKKIGSKSALADRRNKIWLIPPRDSLKECRLCSQLFRGAREQSVSWRKTSRRLTQSVMESTRITNQLVKGNPQSHLLWRLSTPILLSSTLDCHHHERTRQQSELDTHIHRGRMAGSTTPPTGSLASWTRTALCRHLGPAKGTKPRVVQQRRDSNSFLSIPQLTFSSLPFLFSSFSCSGFQSPSLRASDLLSRASRARHLLPSPKPHH